MSVPIMKMTKTKKNQQIVIEKRQVYATITVTGQNSQIWFPLTLGIISVQIFNIFHPSTSVPVARVDFPSQKMI